MPRLHRRITSRKGNAPLGTIVRISCISCARKGLCIMWKIGKKLVIVALVFVALLSHTSAGHKVGSFISTAWGKMVTGAENQVPLEFEIERLRHETAQLVPDMR